MSSSSKRKVPPGEIKRIKKKQKTEAVHRDVQSSLEALICAAEKVSPGNESSARPQSLQPSTSTGMRTGRSTRAGALICAAEKVSPGNESSARPQSLQPSTSTGMRTGRSTRAGVVSRKRKRSHRNPRRQSKILLTATKRIGSSDVKHDTNDDVFEKSACDMSLEGSSDVKHDTNYDVFEKSACDMSLEEFSRKSKWEYRTRLKPRSKKLRTATKKDVYLSSSSSTDEETDRKLPVIDDSERSPTRREVERPLDVKHNSEEDIFEKSIRSLSLEEAGRSRGRERIKERKIRSSSATPHTSGALTSVPRPLRSLSESSGVVLATIPNIIGQLNCGSKLMSHWMEKQTLQVYDKNGKQMTVYLAYSLQYKKVYAVDWEEEKVYSLGHPLDWKTMLAIACEALRIPYPMLDVAELTNFEPCLLLPRTAERRIQHQRSSTPFPVLFSEQKK